MATESTTVAHEEAGGDQLVAILLTMAMFVLVVDTSLMNVSISAVVHYLDTTASGVQSAIALEALVSAAFILIGSKIGDLEYNGLEAGLSLARHSLRYLTRLSSLNIGKYIEMMITPTMAPTPIIISGSMMAVSEAIAASTSSS
jgi:hypothetical protein